MRYSIFAGIPASMVAFTAAWEVAVRFTTDALATLAGIVAMLCVLVALHHWDERRLARLLRPAPRDYGARLPVVREYLMETLTQIRFEDRDGHRAGWRVTSDSPDQIEARINVRVRPLNPNIIAWLVDLVDQGHKTRAIFMRIALSEIGTGTRVAVIYDMASALDWSRCEEVVKDNNRWIDEALSCAGRDERD